MSSSHSTIHSGIRQLYETFHHNKDDVRQFLLMLSHQLPVLVDQIKSGIINDDFDSGFQAAHKLKSPVKMLSEAKLVNQLVELTELLKEAKYPALIAEKFEIAAPGLESLLVLINQELESLDTL
jgi:HPt (histidine-containing phosphotransfer) domain-containing protein